MNIFEIALNICLFCKKDVLWRIKIVQGHTNITDIYPRYPRY